MGKVYVLTEFDSHSDAEEILCVFQDSTTAYQVEGFLALYETEGRFYYDVVEKELR